MLKIKQEMVFSAFLTLCAAIVCYFSLQIGGMVVGGVSSSAFPSILSGLITALALVNTLRCGWQVRQQSAVSVKADERSPSYGNGDGDQAESDAEKGEGGMSRRGALNVLAFVAASIAYVMLLAFVGFVVTTVGYLLVVSLVISCNAGHGLTLKRLLVSLCVSILSTALLYLVFVELLNVRF